MTFFFRKPGENIDATGPVTEGCFVEWIVAMGPLRAAKVTDSIFLFRQTNLGYILGRLLALYDFFWVFVLFIIIITGSRWLSYYLSHEDHVFCYFRRPCCVRSVFMPSTLHGSWLVDGNLRNLVDASPVKYARTGHRVVNL